MKFFTSDHHFGHANILKYEADKRHFADIDAMDQHLIERWNDVVGPSDEVFYLGDLSLKRRLVKAYMPLLNGRKTLVVGNHDSYFKGFVSGKQAKEIAAALEDGFEAITLSMKIEINEIGVVLLSHFPYAPPPEIAASLPDYELRYLDQRVLPGNEVALLHGHVHSLWQTKRDHVDGPIMINVGVDVWNLAPVSETEIVKLFKAQS